MENLKNVTIIISVSYQPKRKITLKKVFLYFSKKNSYISGWMPTKRKFFTPPHTLGWMLIECKIKKNSYTFG